MGKENHPLRREYMQAYACVSFIDTQLPGLVLSFAQRTSSGKTQLLYSLPIMATTSETTFI